MGLCVCKCHAPLWICHSNLHLARKLRLSYGEYVWYSATVDCSALANGKVPEMENHKTIEEQMNIAMLHTALAYKYAYINILWVFPYFNCHANAPPRYALYIFESINQLQSTPSFPLSLRRCVARAKHLPHLVQMSNTCRRRKHGQTIWKIDENPKKRSKTCETQTGNMPRSQKNMCRTLQNKKKWAARSGKDGEVCLTSDSFYTQMTWRHLLWQSGKFSTLPKYLPEARSRCSWSQGKSPIRSVCTLVSSSPNCHLMVH